MKKILVLGGTGLLGRPVARRLQADGFAVRLLARDPDKARAMFGDLCEVVPGDVTDLGSLERYCQVFYPEGKSVSVMPVWLAKVIGTLTRNDTLKFASRLMAYFDKAGELGDPTEANRILGPPTTTLDVWIERRKAKLT